MAMARWVSTCHIMPVHFRYFSPTHSQWKCLIGHGRIAAQTIATNELHEPNVHLYFPYLLIYLHRNYKAINIWNKIGFDTRKWAKKKRSKKKNKTGTLKHDSSAQFLIFLFIPKYKNRRRWNKLKMLKVIGVSLLASPHRDVPRRIHCFQFLSVNIYCLLFQLL